MLTGRQQGNLLSTIEVNQKEECKAITLRSGKEVELVVVSKNSSTENQEAQSANLPQSMEKSETLLEPP
jgi:hypothetical protein